jgi:hypothetical protein
MILGGLSHRQHGRVYVQQAAPCYTQQVSGKWQMIDVSTHQAHFVFVHAHFCFNVFT